MFRDGWAPSHWSARARVTVTATVVVGLLLVAGVLTFYFGLRSASTAQLHERGSHVINELVVYVRTTDPRGSLPIRDPDFAMLQVVTPEGEVLAQTDAMRGRGPFEVPAPSEPGRARTYITTMSGVPSDVYIVVERVMTPNGPRIVYAGSSIPIYSSNRVFFMVALVAVVVLGTVLAGSIVALAVRRALRPVRRMSAELARISGGDQGLVTVPKQQDEVAELAQSVNLTLYRLEDVLSRQRAFVADVSHELRSPITGLHAQLEVALQAPEDEDWPAVARAALAEADRLQGIVSDLLILARLGSGVPADRVRVDLGALVREEAARRPRRAALEIDAEEGVLVRVAPDQIARVLTNLLDNAERHARSWVRVTVAADGAEAVLEVLDDGAGIAREDRGRVFHRFLRLEEGRRRDRGGTGLGLPISRDIADAHGGTLVIAESDAGARLVMRLPLDRPAGATPA
ncbi:HAMP domain-containing sensor histidine kinase [Actinomadura sp. WMMB 499]|uniref:sensor histidine kinase n=1 Tax=Actinomadura sp. WMMB 499 TaxID=1219491 RepID=UPI0020C7D4B8|nr:HAMP domain-containing sensor histidine kinase [Actinomadura sp. WMMB 499]